MSTRMSAKESTPAIRGAEFVSLVSTAQQIFKYVYTSRPYEKAAPSIHNGAMLLNEGARLNRSSVKAQLDWFKASGLIKSDIGIDELVDGSYVETY